MSLKNRHFGLSIFLLFLVSCTVAPLPPERVPSHPMAPIPARVLLLVPYEFESYTYSGPPLEPGLGVMFGRYAVDEMSMQLGPAFDTFVIKPVRSDEAAYAMLSPNDVGNAEVLRYDYVAIPRFTKVRSWTQPDRFGYEVDIMLELYSADGSQVTKIHGHGETATGHFSGSSPIQSARLALSYAVSAVRDEIESKRHLFIPHQR